MMNVVIDETLSCRKSREAMLECFEEGALQTPPQSLADHLKYCASCRAEWEKLQALSGRLRSLPIPDPGMNYRLNLLPAVRLNLEKRPALAKRDLTWAPSMALAILLVLALVRQPAPVAPPSWYQPQVTSQDIGSMAFQDCERLSSALDQRDSLALDLSGHEIDLILNFSNDAAITLDDPVSRLSTLSDEAVEAVFKKLETASIRS